MTGAPVPPEDLIFVGPGDFRSIGDEYLRYCVDLGGLRPRDAVLDVGCGIGRIAIPLTDYLSADGAYDGFDIVQFGIEWCRANVSPRHPNFRFEHAPIFNRSYNVVGRYEASTYAFPYPAGRFDFALAVSVFPHLLPEDLENYVYETARALKVGGRSLATFFLLNGESERLLAERRSQLDFKHGSRSHRTVGALIPEDAVGHDEGFVRDVYARYGLEIEPPVRYGSWCGRAEFLGFQDIVVATKRGDTGASKPRPSAGRRLALAARRMAYQAATLVVRDRGTWAARRHVRARRPKPSS